jgi:DNA-binding MarR family transcriptional regulator
MVSNKRADLVLSNGAEVNFKVAKDETGAPVVSSLEISFPAGFPVPQGGVSSATLREITMRELLSIWFAESSRSFLGSEEEKILWRVLREQQGPSGRRGLSETYYSCLAYLYVRQCEISPTSPTSEIAEKLQVSPKTISTRLAQAKKLGVLSSSAQNSTQTRAGGEVTPLGKKLVLKLVKESL